MRTLLVLLPILFYSISAKLIHIESEEEFNSKVLKSSKPVFVVFSATWCSPCRRYKPIVEEESNSHKDMLFVTLDIDKLEAIADKFGVTGVPASYIIKRGKVIKNTKGNLSEEELKEFIQKK